MESEILEKKINLSYERILENLKGNMQEESWELVISDKFELKNGKKIIEICGISSSFGGITFLSFIFQGVRSLHFFVRIKEISKNSSEVFISTGGSETIFGFDWGRNKNITLLIEKLCKKNLNLIFY